MFLLKYALVFALSIVTFSEASKEKPYYKLKDAPKLFKKFQKDYNRQYQDEDDKESHYEAFVANLLRINHLNSIQDSAVYDINKFADHTAEDNTFLLGYRKNDEKHKASKHH